MKIVDVKPYKKNTPNVFTVKTDDDIVYILHLDAMLEHNIFANCDVDEKNLKSANEKSEFLIASAKAINYVSATLKTEKQIKTYLKKKNFSDDTIKKVIQKLYEYKIIDDEYYAKQYTNFKSKSRSKNYIKNKLYENGIDKDIIESSLEICDDYNVANNDAKKFFKTKESTQKNIEKLIHHLQYKGFSWETIKKVLENFKGDKICE